MLSENTFNVEKFADITHIWFSHEHPDHFSPPNPNKIPQAYKSKITVLFQETTDKKVAEYCRKVGFANVIEIPTNEYVVISEKVKLKCNPFTDGDSWLYIKTDKYNLLNINDCVINNEAGAQQIKSQIDTVDVLFTQFGYANKVGNEADITLREIASKEKLTRIAIQDAVFLPQYIVPFASYVYFCHQENYYMNSGMNRVNTIHDFVTTKLKKKSIVLYPGDIWKIGDNHENLISITKYNEDYQEIDSGKRQLIKDTSTIEEQLLISASKQFADKLRQHTPLSLYLPPVYYWITDFNVCYQFDAKSGLVKLNKEKENSDISLSSSALLYTFKFLWGGDTLQVNARFQILGNYRKVRNYYNIAAALNRGEKIDIKTFIKHLSISLIPQKLISIVRKPLSS